MLYPAELRARAGSRLARIARGGNRSHNSAHNRRGTRVETEGPATDAASTAGHKFRYFDFVMAAFVAILLLSNVIGAGKVAQVWLPGVGYWPFGAGILFFPISYVIGDVLTEVYGYARARRVIWAGTVAVLFMAFMSWVVVALPPAPDWTNQAAYETIFGQVPRIVFASVCAFWVGRVRQFLRAGADEGVDAGAASVDAHDRLDGRGAGGRQPDLLSARLLGRGGVDQRSGAQGAGHAVGAEGLVGSRADAGHLCRRSAS